MKYKTDLSISECVSRLRQTAAQHKWSIERLWIPLPSGTVECKMWGRWFLLFAWPREYTRNSFAPVFCGYLEQRPDGVAMRGRFMFHPIVLLFLIVWFGGALLGIGLAVHHVICQLSHDGPCSASVFTPIAVTLGVAAAGFVIVYLGLRLGKSQRETIEAYLHTTLGAKKCSSDTPG
jgi:hypothetical protein